LTDAVQRFRAGESVNAAAVSLKLQQYSLLVSLCATTAYQRCAALAQ